MESRESEDDLVQRLEYTGKIKKKIKKNKKKYQVKRSRIGLLTPLYEYVLDRDP